MIEKTISQFVQNQFPSFYNEEGENFVLFAKAYYEWLESNNQTLYHARRLQEYRDIDTTVDDFIVYFKEKYLKNIRLETIANQKMLVKHSLELHRSKGSARAIDLFFKLVFGVDADVRHPGKDIFRSSAARWIQPLFIEVTDSDMNASFEGKEIKGTVSGSKAYVERYHRKKNLTGYTNVLYLTNITRGFEIGEQIFVDSITEKNPKIIGSIRNVDMTGVTGTFTKGEIVKLVSATSDNCRAVYLGNNVLKLIASGFGYNTSNLSIVGATGTATGLPDKASIGFEEGFSEDDEGYLSSNKKLQDGEYIQEFSYEIFSSLSFDRYSDILKDSLHVAGTKMFGSIENTSIFTLNKSIETEITQDTVVLLAPLGDSSLVTADNTTYRGDQTT